MKISTCILGILLLLFFLPHYVLAQGIQSPIPPVPTNGNVVLDALDWLTPSQESEINRINEKLDAEGIAQLAVVILDDCGNDKKKFRIDLFNAWGVGHKANNDGLLIMVCWYEGDQARRSVEQTTGYGLENVLTDQLTSQIASEFFIPAFQEDRPGEGLVAMVKEYDRILRQGGQNLQSAKTNKNNQTFILAVTALGFLPGFVLSTYYVNVWKSQNKLVTKVKKGRKRIAYKNEFMGIIFPGIDKFAVAEIIALLPVLIILYNRLEGVIGFRPIGQEFREQLLNYLIAWVALLLLYFISPLFPRQRDDGRNSSNSTWWNSDRDGSDGGSSFDGGASGGGGSSTGF